MEEKEFNKLSEMYARKINECVDLQSENASLQEELEDIRKKFKALDTLYQPLVDEAESLRSSLSEKEAIIESNCNSYKEQLNDAHLKLAEKERECDALRKVIKDDKRITDNLEKEIQELNVKLSLRQQI